MATLEGRKDHRIVGYIYWDFMPHVRSFQMHACGALVCARARRRQADDVLCGSNVEQWKCKIAPTKTARILYRKKYPWNRFIFQQAGKLYHKSGNCNNVRIKMRNYASLPTSLVYVKTYSIFYTLRQQYFVGMMFHQTFCLEMLYLRLEGVNVRNYNLLFWQKEGIAFF